MKRVLFYCVVLVITFSQFGCNRLSEDINGNYLYMQYLVQSQNHDALLVNIAYTEKAEIGYVEQYYRLDLQNYHTETISFLKGRQLNLLKSKYEAFDIDNFIATNAPDNDPRETEIGLFHNSYVPLIKDSSAGVLYDSVQDDRCVYCFDKVGMISDSVNIMNRDGTNQTTIPLGIEAVITDYFKLTPEIGCINAYNAGPERLSISALINFKTKQVKLYMETGKAYTVKGVINNAFLIKESNIQMNIDRFFLVQSDGSESSDLFQISVKDAFEDEYCLLDPAKNRFFYAFIRPDNSISVCCFDFSTMKMHALFPDNKEPTSSKKEFPNTQFSSSLYLVKESNTISFVLSDGAVKKTWYLMNCGTMETTSIPIPENTDITLSPDGKYVLCANTNGKNGKNGIITFNKQTYIALSERLNLGVRSGLYNPLMEEFIVPLRNDTKGDSLYRVNADGEVKVFNVEK